MTPGLCIAACRTGYGSTDGAVDSPWGGSCQPPSAAATTALASMFVLFLRVCDWFVLVPSASMFVHTSSPTCTRRRRPAAAACVHACACVRGVHLQVAAGGQPRIMLHVSLAPKGANLRGRPTALLGSSAETHVRRWRGVSLDPSGNCDSHASCRTCTKDGPTTAAPDDTAGWRTGCAWCAASNKCVPDVTGTCAGPREHVGGAGLLTTCPSGHSEL